VINEPLFRLPIDDPDIEVETVGSELYRLDPTGNQVATVLRDTLDQLYDGQRTGRWKYDHLHKTEKTYMGTLVEINLHRMFGFDDGDATDYRIAGIEVDCKYSMTYGGWELPPEAIDHLCLLITANDETSSWSAGLIRVREEYLRGKPNRDSKRQLSAVGRARVRQLWSHHGRLAENLFLHMDPRIRERVFSAQAKRGTQHGQARTHRTAERGNPGAWPPGQRPLGGIGARPAGSPQRRARLRTSGAGTRGPR
jgi:Restriction endonuclease NaeI